MPRAFHPGWLKVADKVRSVRGTCACHSQDASGPVWGTDRHPACRHMGPGLCWPTADFIETVGLLTRHAWPGHTA